MKFFSPTFLFTLYLANVASVLALPVDIEGSTGLSRRQNMGSIITVGGVQYRLDDEVSGEGGAVTFRATAVTTGETFYAKRPRVAGEPSQAFENEIRDTRRASEVLGTNIFVASGSDLNYTWMITAPAPGVEIWLRWNADRTKFATRAACEADMETARNVIISQNRRLATSGPSGAFVHGDNHPGNWYVPLTGAIDTAVPIDFGLVRPPSTNIETLVRDQYVYNAAMWAIFVQDGFCR